MREGRRRDSITCSSLPEATPGYKYSALSVNDICAPSPKDMFALSSAFQDINNAHGGGYDRQRMAAE